MSGGAFNTPQGIMDGGGLSTLGRRGGNPPRGGEVLPETLNVLCNQN